MQPTSHSPSADGASGAPKKQPAWLYKRVGRYKLLALLGEGAIGRVFRAEDLQLGRQVALKVISTPPNSSKPLHTVEKALSEARLAAGLEHPHIVHVYEVGNTASYCYIAMELVDGGNLKDLIKASGPMDYPRACQLVADAAEALAYSHDQGVIHRDVNPANLMLGRGGRCKLADFGLAVLQKSRSSEQGHDRPAGTPQFIAPEVIRGEEAGVQSDLYSLAATLWCLLTGTPPFVADSTGEVLEKHLNEPLPDLAKLRPELPEGLVRGITKALDKDPAQRYESAEQFARFLRVYTIPLAAGGSSGASLALLADLKAVQKVASERPGAINRVVLWGGLAALAGTAAMSSVVYWYYTDWASFRTRAPLTSIIARPAKPVILPPVPTGIFQATDTAALTHLAAIAPTTRSTTQPATAVTIDGVVAANQVSKHAKYFRITFVGNDEKSSFVCTYKPELLPALQSEFGGNDGPGLKGKHIRVTGSVEMFKDRPTIKIDDLTQIQLLP